MAMVVTLVVTLASLLAESTTATPWTLRNTSSWMTSRERPALRQSGFPDGMAQDCVCVPYYQCEEKIKQREQGMEIIEINSEEVSRCDHYLDYCCKRPARLPPSKNPQLFTDYPHPTPPPPQPSQRCGRLNPRGVGFHIAGLGDDGAQFGEFPWMVAIVQRRRVDGIDKPLNVFQCGGALVLAQVVVTAAHCVAGKDPSTLIVRAGEWDTQTTKELYAHQDVKGAQVIGHPSYNSKTLHNDIALLVLLDPVRLGGPVGLLCLPQQGQTFDYKRCLASGWGKERFEQDGLYSVILKKIQLPVVPNPKCQELLRRTRLGAHFLLDASFICAGGETNRDTCRGDGGSPLVCPTDSDPGRYFHAGIVAWGINCGLAETPGVYVNVARYRQWIDAELSRLNVDISGYSP